MSRRASLYKKKNPGRPRVRFPDELVFQDSVKENDIEHMHQMLRRASLQMDLNCINSAGLTALHQAVLDDKFTAVRLLLKHGAQVNQLDEDGWTPLHAACAEGHSNIARYLLKKGADPTILNPDEQRPIDLCEPTDMSTISILIQANPPRLSPSSRYRLDSDSADSDDRDSNDSEDGKPPRQQATNMKRN